MADTDRLGLAEEMAAEVTAREVAQDPQEPGRREDGASEGMTAKADEAGDRSGDDSLRDPEESKTGEENPEGTGESGTGEDAAEPEAVVAGIHNYSSEEHYVRPADERVLRKLEWFQDQKIGLMMHWGPYSQLGIVESWALSDQDADWSRDGIDWEVTGEEFKKEYFALNKTFNPIRFEPEKWADLAKEAGMRYFLFTTKHHDGFCMWDTRYSDYKITGPDCPFHTHKYADICAHLFESFRKRGIGIVAYFSKADWHVDSYWREDTPKGRFKSRGPSYVPAKDPEQWQRFVEFTQNQIRELATGYGRLEGMWFDAGWVCEQAGQDIRLGEVIEEIRQFQPGMLCADRTIGGPYENYVTPEQCVPPAPLSIPWESCITLGTSFSFKFEDTYKSPRQVIGLLVDIVVKGGNLAINVGPQPDGRIPQGAIRSLRGIGAWLSRYGEAIYGTRVCAPYQKDGMGFTRKGDTVYAIQVFARETDPVEDILWIPYEKEVKEIRGLGETRVLSYERRKGGYQVVTAPGDSQETEAPIARVFVLEQAAC